MRLHWPVYRSLPIVLLLVLVGSGQAQPTPISIEDAKAIKSGSSLSEVNAVLGEPHEPTSIQANAKNDRRFDWGTDDSFFVAVVNEQDVAWVVSWHAGSTPPTMPSVTSQSMEPGHP